MNDNKPNGITITEPGVWVCLPRHAVESITPPRDDDPLEDFREDFRAVRSRAVRVELKDGHTIDVPHVVIINP